VTDHQPNDLEDRIRDAYQSAERTVQTLQRTCPVPAAGSVGRPRRMSAFAPIAAAAAVIVVIVASVGLPRLLTHSSPNPAAPRVSAPGYPPFQVVVTVESNLDSRLQVELAATGHVVTSVAPPWPGAVWGAVAAVGDTGRFIVAAAPKSPPWTPTRLYSFTLSARGTVAGLTPLAVPALPGQLTSLAASADGRTIAYTLFPGAGRANEVGVITGGGTRQWGIPSIGTSGQGDMGIWDVSVSSDGSMVAFTTESNDGDGLEDTAWVLPTGSAPGSLTARARKVYEHPPIDNPKTGVAILDSALISPDGSTLYLATSASPANGKVMTALTAYRTAGGASPGTITTWDGGYYDGLGEILTPDGGMLLAWNPALSTAYLINPATRTRTTLPLRGIPRVQFAVGLHVQNVILAW
jgi:hypothetical protein